MKKEILGVKIDDYNMDQALEKVLSWLKEKGKHYIVTPNPEFIVAADKDPEFKKILNNADLAIPDGSSLGFSYWLLKRNKLIRLILWPIMLTPLKQLMSFDRVAGIELMESLCNKAADYGFTIGLLGGDKEVAEKCADCLRKKYQKLKIVYIDSGGVVDQSGQLIEGEIKPLVSMDILFVAFGHIKQEKWIKNNLPKIPVKVAMGVGGAFDYLSGNIPRAPEFIRDLGFEWLFRLIIEPWRIKRQFALLKYLYLIMVH